ncbi:OVALX protein, partial [Psilopogon haemacephalus]|nr:OVALX protein [Psilopogon haemacephalus]
QIKDILAPGSVGVDTSLVLVNAIYFKGPWKTAFKKEDTQELPFKVTEQESKPVQMMRQNGTFRVTEVPEKKMKILELPYAGDEMSMLVLLSDDISGLEQLEKKISFQKIREWTSPNVMEEKRVEVYLPRMKFEEKYNLTSILVALGMTDLFSPLADLSGISSAESLKLSEAIHEAHVEVDEEGTSTSGTEDVAGELKNSPDMQFRADHPFIFLVRHNPTDSIFFLGRYTSP